MNRFLFCNRVITDQPKTDLSQHSLLTQCLG